MAIQSYTGNPRKSIFENRRFHKGIRYTNESLQEGTVKMLANLDINKSGVSLRPRMPYFNSVGRFGTDSPKGFSQLTLQFQPHQDNSYDYFIEFDAPRSARKVVTVAQKSDITVVDGDTFMYQNRRYRLALIDAPELGSASGNAAKTAFETILANVPASAIQIHFDGVVDIYNRPIVWLVLRASPQDVLMNYSLLSQGFVKLYGEYGDVNPIVIPNYIDIISGISTSSFISSRAALIADANDASPIPASIWHGAQKSVTTIDDPTTNIAISRKIAKTNYQVYQETLEHVTTPTVALEKVTQISLSRIHTDLELIPGEPIKIEMCVQEYEMDKYTHVYKNRYLPYVSVVNSEMDGIVFIGRVLQGETELYKGIVSMNYIVPLDEYTDTVPQYNLAYFEFATYKNEYFKIDIARSFDYSPNLLAREAQPIDDLVGEDADDAGYSFASIRGYLFKNTYGTRVVQLKRNNIYTIKPILALPTLNVGQYHYIRYDVFQLTRNSQAADATPVISTEWSVIDAEPVALKTSVISYHGIVGDALDLQFQALDSEKKTDLVLTAAQVQAIYFSYGSGLSYPDYYPEALALHAASKNLTAGHVTRISCPTAPAGSGIKDAGYIYIGNYYEGCVLKTDGTIFNNSSSGIYVITYVSSGSGRDYTFFNTDADSYTELQANQTFLATPYMWYTTDERPYTETVYGTRLAESKKIAYFNDRYVLYGGDKARNVLYISDVNNISYFPLKFAMDQFDAPIIHVRQYGEQLLVFTLTDIYLVTNVPREIVDAIGNVTFEDVYVAKKVLTNISLQEPFVNTIVEYNKYILFTNHQDVYVLRPNMYTEDNTDVYSGVISQNIADLLTNPTNFIAQRQRFFGITYSDIFTDSYKPDVELFGVVYNNVYSLFLSTSLTNDEVYMIQLRYDIVTGIWLGIYDTRACAFPYQMVVFDATEGVRFMMANYNIRNSATMMVLSGLQLWDFAQGVVHIADIKAIKNVSGTAVYNSQLFTNWKLAKHPIHCFIDSGHPHISPHLHKRFLEAIVELTNIDCETIPFSLDFYVDGQGRQQSATSTVIQVYENGVGVFTEYIANELTEGLAFSNFTLDLARFGPLQRVNIRTGISGRGRIPQLLLGFQTTGMFEIYRYGVVYKEQAVR